MHIYYLICAALSGVDLNNKQKAVLKMMVAAIVIAALLSGGPYDD